MKGSVRNFLQHDRQTRAAEVTHIQGLHLVKTTDIERVVIERMTHGGYGLARVRGKPTFIPYSIAGETVDIRIEDDRGSHAFAAVNSIISRAAQRTLPRCPHFGPQACGGCQWQHIDYQAQLGFKREIVLEQLHRIGGIDSVPVNQVIPSALPWHYRTHATLRLAEGLPAFVAADPTRLQIVDTCHILREELLELLEQIRQEDTEHWQRMRLQVGSASQDRLLAITPVEGARIRRPRVIRASFGILDRNGQYEALHGADHVHYTVSGHTFRCSAGSFFQVNLPQAEALADQVRIWLKQIQPRHVLDLYCGVGLFTIFAAECCGAVTAVELSPTAVRDAHHNLRQYAHVTIIQGALERVINRLQGPFDAAIVDPPRVGLRKEALSGLIKLAPKHILYVSCDPTTLARDCKTLVSAGYELLQVQPLDMFPQTFHIECIARLEKR